MYKYKVAYTFWVHTSIFKNNQKQNPTSTSTQETLKSDWEKTLSSVCKWFLWFQLVWTFPNFCSRLSFEGGFHRLFFLSESETSANWMWSILRGLSSFFLQPPLNSTHMFLIDLGTPLLSRSFRKKRGREEKKVSTETLNSLFSLSFSGARFKELNHTRMCSLGHAGNRTHDLGLLQVSPFTFRSPYLHQDRTKTISFNLPKRCDDKSNLSFLLPAYVTYACSRSKKHEEDIHYRNHILRVFLYKCAKRHGTGTSAPHTPPVLLVSHTQSNPSCLISLYPL